MRIHPGRLATTALARFLLFLFIMVSYCLSSHAQGAWTPVALPAPDYNHGVMILLTDGSVLVKTSAGSFDTYGGMWDRLTPDIHGSYVNGTWTQTSAMYNSRLYFSTQVLRNGTLYVAGGEYGTGRTVGEVYYPQADVWVPAPTLPFTYDTISDANSEILPDGKVLQAVVVSGSSIGRRTYIYDPANNTYTVGTTTLGNDNESAWVKLPDNSILYENIASTASERYIPATNTWVADANLPVGLYDPYGEETGAGFLLPDGRAFFLGSTSHSAFYTPSGSTAPGAWSAGAAIPDNLGAPDAAAAMMADGKILCTFSPTPIVDSVFQHPMYFYVYDYQADTFTRISAPDGSDSLDEPSYFSNMLCLPDGSVLYSSQGDDQYYVYQPSGAPLSAGKPTVTGIINGDCDTFRVTGTLFNGITEGAAYGDDWQMATNYPIVRLSRNDTVLYATTYNWNSTGVMRGALPDTAQFVLPVGFPGGTWSLQVVANGNASAPYTFAGCDGISVPNTIAKNSALSVYPNPAETQATVVFRSANGGLCSIRLIDVYGRAIKSVHIQAVAGENNYTLQLSGVAPGVYSVLLRDGSGVNTTRLIVK